MMDLPEEMLVLIMGYMDYNELVTISRVNRRFVRIAEENLLTEAMMMRGDELAGSWK